MSRLQRIVSACGGELLDGGRRALIPGPGHSGRDRSVSLIETQDGRLLIYCFSPKDDWRAVRDALEAKGLLGSDGGRIIEGRSETTPIPAPVDDKDRRARARRIWRECRPLGHTPAASYLKARAISSALMDCEALRFHPQMTSLDDKLRRPALVCAITDAHGTLQGVQATLLADHRPTKALVATPRRVIGKLMGGVVRLQPFAGEFAIGEGVETMLSASAALGLPAAAALTAGNLATFAPPAIVRRLVIAVDNDEAGYAAAEHLRKSVPIAVTIAPPPNGAKDWNDYACNQAV
jgi:hypothetical protein